MAKLDISTKRIQINKANLTMVIVVSIATFVTIFSLVASKALVSQYMYQNKVIEKKEVARDQLKENIKAVDTLVTSYKAFVSTPENVIGGNPAGQGDKDGDNAKIILDALPSKYDFPALATSLEKILVERNYRIESITGTDDELNQASKAAQGTTPAPVEMPFTVNVKGSFASMQDLLGVLERSIRPIQVLAVSFTGSDAELTAEIKAKTYYQPEKTLDIKSEVVK